MEKQNEVYSPNELLFSSKKKVLTYHKHGPALKICYMKGARHKGSHGAWFNLYELISKQGKFMEIDNNLTVAGGWGDGELWGVMLKGPGFPSGVIKTS